MSGDFLIESEIDYQGLWSDAIRSMLLKILADVAEKGRLPGNHRFSITFDTNHPEAYIPKYLRAKFPDVMTISLQPGFENLRVTTDTIQVTLKFSGQSEDIKIPAASILKFVDSVFPEQVWLMYPQEKPVTLPPTKQVEEVKKQSVAIEEVPDSNLVILTFGR